MQIFLILMGILWIVLGLQVSRGREKQAVVVRRRIISKEEAFIETDIFQFVVCNFANRNIMNVIFTKNYIILMREGKEQFLYCFSRFHLEFDKSLN